MRDASCAIPRHVRCAMRDARPSAASAEESVQAEVSSSGYLGTLGRFCSVSVLPVALANSSHRSAFRVLIIVGLFPFAQVE